MIEKKNKKTFFLLGSLVIISSIGVILVAGLLFSIFGHKQEMRHPFVRLVEVDESTTDPAVWGVNWPRQYDSYVLTVDAERTRYGGSDAIPKQKLDADPWLRKMWSGYAFSLDYREARGHAYMLLDQEQTERVLQRPQPGACLHCHASIIPTYRFVGEGDVHRGFLKVSAMNYEDARHLTDKDGNPLVQHPASCVDCHNPTDMSIRVTRPAFKVGIAALKKSQGVEDYDVNRDANRQEMRTYVCAQCHVEYYFKGDEKTVVYPWEKGIKVEEIEQYYDELNYSDWQHGVTGAGVLKAQHPEFEMWNQGIHARAGVACADCHMPYSREGAMKVSSHHVRSPLLNVNSSCQTCHNIKEEEIINRVHVIQDRTRKLIDRASQALTAMIDTIGAAKAAGVSDLDLQNAYSFQRKAQWRLDFVYSENSMGFHASQEAARILAEAIDYAHRGQLAVAELLGPPLPPNNIPIEPVHGVTAPENGSGH